MPRAEAPLEKVELQSKLKRYAEEHNLVIDWYHKSKILWSEEHGGRCFCDWDSDRRCPCSHIQEDLVKYNGSCLCSVLATRDKMKRLRAYRRRVRLKREEKEKGEIVGLD